MQAEHPPLRGGGFIISPQNSGSIPKAKPLSPPRKKKAVKIKELIFPVLNDYCSYAESMTSLIISKLLCFTFLSLGYLLHHFARVCNIGIFFRLLNSVIFCGILVEIF